MQVDIELYRHELSIPLRPPIRLPVIDIAPDHPRRTLVFLHGFGGNVSQWRRQLTHFSDGNRVIAVGLRGHGASGTTLGPFSTAQLLQDLQAARAARSDLSPRLHEVRLPTLVVVGQRDRTVPPEDGRLAARRISGAQLIELPTDHHPGDEAPEAFLAALREFLKESGSRS